MDATQALSMVANGYAQPGWQVLNVRTGHLVGRIIGGLFGMVVGVIGIAIASFFVTGAFGGFGGADASFTTFGALIGGLVLLGFAAAFVFSLGWLLSGILILLRSKGQRPVLILAPDGVVERGGFWGSRVRAVSYADIAHAQLRVTTNTTVNAQTGARSTSVSHAMIFTHLDGRKEKWGVDGAFGRPDDIASRIITAQIQYAALHGMRRP
jgi:hypothetical protein